MKKKIITLLATITSLFLLTGCGGFEITEKVEITSLNYYNIFKRRFQIMKKKIITLLATITSLFLLTGCGGFEITEKVEITWSWGTLRGLYGDAEITFNENGTPI